MWAVLSDIHGNLEALDAVLADAARHPVTYVFCLGDLVGYGPNPVECVERAMAWDMTVLGNFDYALFECIDGLDGWSAHSAAASLVWARSLLQVGPSDPRSLFLLTRPDTHRVEDFLLVHGTPRNPLNEYLFPEDVYNERKMSKIAACFDRYCLCGHTHVPGAFVEPGPPGGRWDFFSPEEFRPPYRLDGRKAVVNVGSVGQPRDGDWRACYALVDGQGVTFRRVPYDVDATVRKIHANPELADFLGDRLREGR